MMKMVKFDIAELQAAFGGTTGGAGAGSLMPEICRPESAEIRRLPSSASSAEGRVRAQDRDVKI
jgi:hypothetical protein